MFLIIFVCFSQIGMLLYYLNGIFFFMLIQKLRQMQDLLFKLDQKTNLKDIMRQACKRNNLNTALAGQLTVAKLKLFTQRFKKAYSTQDSKIKTNWIENELKAYNWILIALSALENVKIVDFPQKQWILLQNIFQYKTRNFLKFEARRFLQQKKTKNKNWSEEQNRYLLKIVKQIQSNDHIKIQNAEKEGHQFKEEMNSNNQLKSLQSNKSLEKKQRVHWNEVARTLFQQSNEMYFRSAKHCRERWYNYIDPTIQRGKWNEEQDDRLLQFIKIKGQRWAEIASILHRTEHNVKNRYHSLQIKFLKIGKRSAKPQLKQKIMTTSIEEKLQEPKIELIPIKQETQKTPVITIAKFTQKNSFRQNQNDAQIEKFFEEVDNLHEVKQDQNKYLKNDCSFFAYSPMNLTPLIGSPSPLNFTIKGFACSQKSWTEDMLNKNSNLSNERK